MNNLFCRCVLFAATELLLCGSRPYQSRYRRRCDATRRFMPTRTLSRVTSAAHLRRGFSAPNAAPFAFLRKAYHIYIIPATAFMQNFSKKYVNF